MKIFRYKIRSIKSKLLLITSSIVLLFGISHLIIINLVVKDKIEERFINRGIRLGYHLASEIEEPLLYDNNFQIQQALIEWEQATPDHAYAIIVSPDGQPLVTTFTNNVPLGLIKANLPDKPVNKVIIINDNEIRYYDIAVPIMNGLGGFLRLGLRESSVSSPIQDILNILIFMVAVFVFIGSIGAYYVSKLITDPISKIVQFSDTVDLGGQNIDLNIKTGDEIEILSNKFENMIERLKINHMELSKANKQVYENEKLASIGYLASGIAHEIRNPLMGITNGLKRIDKNPNSIDQIKKYIPVMLRGSEHIETILNGLLQYARNDTGIITTVDLNATISDAVSFISHRILEKKISLSYDNSVNYSVFGNRQNITQILINLMINAIEAMPSEGIITIKIEKNNKFLWINLTDTGTGISNESLDKIWEPFYTSKKEGKGTGLGLAVTKSLIESNGGEIICTSVENKGTTFSFSLKLNEENEYVNK